jgi:hypothetical protein
MPMVSRRILLKIGGALAGAAALGSCTPAPSASGKYALFLTTAAGLTVLDELGTVLTPPTAIAASTPDWRHAVTAEAEGAGTRVTVRDLLTGQVHSANALAERLEPRIISGDGRFVASVTPGGAGIYGLHEPGGRDRTTIVVSGPGGELATLDLPGNLEPEVFSPDGSRLFVWDYFPAQAPDRYQMKVIDLKSGEMTAVPTRSGSATVAATRVARVTDDRRGVLFGLYVDTRNAFIHCLSLREGWSHQIVLPAPFGQGRPGVHTIALTPSPGRLSVFHSLSASVADLDPDTLTLKQIWTLSPDAQDGKPSMLMSPQGDLIASVDGKIIVSQPFREIGTPGQTRGLVFGAGGDIWAGHPDGAVNYDLATGQEIRRIRVPKMFVLKHCAQF